MTIKGQFTKQETNTYGYTTIWVAGTRYGSDKKGAIAAVSGDLVSFEAYEKPGKDGRTWPTFQYSTFKKEAAAAAVAAAPEAEVFRAKAYVPKPDPWAEKDPRISFFASNERAIQLVDLYIKHGALESLAKAKPTMRKEIIDALVFETTERLMAQAYAAAVPTAKPKELVSDLPDEEKEATDESWS